MTCSAFKFSLVFWDSFDPDPSSFHSGSDAFGGGGVSWSTAFNHDDEADSGVRASWGMQSSAPSTQVRAVAFSSRRWMIGVSCDML